MTTKKSKKKTYINMSKSTCPLSTILQTAVQYSISVRRRPRFCRSATSAAASSIISCKSIGCSGSWRISPFSRRTAAAGRARVSKERRTTLKIGTRQTAKRLEFRYFQERSPLCSYAHATSKHAGARHWPSRFTPPDPSCKPSRRRVAKYRARNRANGERHAPASME